MDMDCGQFSVIWIKCQFVNHKVIIELSLYPLTYGTKVERLNPACFVLYQIIQLQTHDEQKTMVTDYN